MPDTTSRRPPTGAEYIESLRDGREIHIYGERVRDVTTHPAFRNSVRSIARLYDAFADPAYADVLTTPTDTGNGGLTHPFFKVAHTRDDLRASRDACRAWAELTYGWMGRTPDYKAALTASLGADPEWYGEYAGNARDWYRRTQEELLFLGHALVHPPVDRHLPLEQVRDVYVHVEKETDAGLVVSGAKVVATGSAITDGVFVTHFGPPVKDRAFALQFFVATSAPGVKLLARASYEKAAATVGSPMDYPLSSRFDENDSALILDDVLIPWEDVLIYDVGRINADDFSSGWRQRALLQASVRMLTKIDLIIGTMAKALEIKGGERNPLTETSFGEAIAIRQTIAALVDGMIEGAQPAGRGSSLVPADGYGAAYAATAPRLFTRLKEIIETTVSSGLIYLNSHVSDFDSEARPLLDRFMRGSGGIRAEERVKTMKLLWDAIGTEFGGRHELYEYNYFGTPQHNFQDALAYARDSGELAGWRELADRAMGDYDLSGWTSTWIDPSTPEIS